MKHRHGNRILGRKNTPRARLLQNLTSALLSHGKIVTTEAKGKELRRFFEPLITQARGEITLARRRLLLQRLGRREDLPVLLEVAKQFQGRPGGYTRLTRLPVTRKDAAREVTVELVAAETTTPTAK